MATRIIVSTCVVLLLAAAAWGQGDEPAMRGGGRHREPGEAPINVPHYRRQWAIIIGLDYTHLSEADADEVPRLATAESDARALYDLLLKNYGYTPETAKLLLGKDATRDNIRKLLGDQFLANSRQVTSEDSVLVYFAGHGNRRGAAEDEKHYVGLLYPADVEILPNQGVDTISCLRISELLEPLRDYCAARHKLVILDSCHSGEVFNFGKFRNVANRGFQANLFREPAFQAIAAAQGSQRAADADASGKHSPVTGALLEALEHGPTGSEQTLFTASELFSYIPRRVKEMGIQQDPRGNWISGEGDFYFFPTSLTPGAIPSRELALWHADQRSGALGGKPAGSSWWLTIAGAVGVVLLVGGGIAGWRLKFAKAQPKITPLLAAPPASPTAAPATNLAGPLLCLRVAGSPCIYQAPPGAEIIRVGRQRRKPGDSADKGNDFVIRDDEDADTLKISRRHFEIRRLGEQFTITDLSSAGTSVNGHRLPTGEARPLLAGDTIDVAGILQLEVLLPVSPLAGALQPQVSIPRQAANQRQLVAEASIGDMITDESADA
ncbi:MAG: caspase family protein [Pirellulaceae bacterium]|nr:caspase family protein [Pirellulaceae bacterium]